MEGDESVVSIDIEQQCAALTNEELIRIWKDSADNEALRSQMMELFYQKNEHLVDHLLNKYFGIRVMPLRDASQSTLPEWYDLRQAGLMALIEAVPEYADTMLDRYEQQGGRFCKFSTFFDKNLRKAVYDCIQSKSGISEYERVQLLKLKTARKKLENSGKEVTALDLMHELGVGPEALDSILAIESGVTAASYDEVCNRDDEDLGSVAFNVASNNPSPARVIIEKEKQERIEAAIEEAARMGSNNKERVREIFHIIYGFDDKEELVEGLLLAKLCQLNGVTDAAANAVLELLRYPEKNEVQGILKTVFAHEMCQDDRIQKLHEVLASRKWRVSKTVKKHIATIVEQVTDNHKKLYNLVVLGFRVMEKEIVSDTDIAELYGEKAAKVVKIINNTIARMAPMLEDLSSNTNAIKELRAYHDSMTLEFAPQPVAASIFLDELAAAERGDETLIPLRQYEELDFF